MKTITSKVREAWEKLPPRAQSALRALVTTFAAVFVAVAAPLLPAIIDSPDVNAAKALILAAIAAGTAAALRASVPLATAYAKALGLWLLSRLTLPNS